MPSITGRVEVNLTVRDPLSSAAWYAQLLGMVNVYEFVPSDGRVSYACLVEPSSGLVLCLVGHPTNPGEPFDETHTGLDHLEFLVATREGLNEWASRLDQLGVEHSGVKQPARTRERDAHVSRLGQHPTGVLLAQPVSSTRVTAGRTAHD